MYCTVIFLGHTFCFNCISKSIEATKKCPKCNYIISTVESIFPNFLLNELITKHKFKEEQKQKLFSRNSTASSVNASSTIPDVGDTQTSTEESTDQLKTFLATESNKLTLPDVNVMLEILTQRKLLLENESVASQNRLLHEFLKYLLRKTETQQQQLEKKINLIKGDIRIVEGILKGVQSSCPTMAELDSMDKKKSMDGCDNKMVQAIRDEMKQLISTIDSASMLGICKKTNPQKPHLKVTYIKKGLNFF